MKAFIKIMIVLALINAAGRVGLVAMSHYRLKDAVQQEATWGGRIPVAQISRRVLEKAAELDVPLEATDVDVSREKDLTVISVGYTRPVELFPTFVYPLELSFSVQARAFAGLK